MTDESRLPILTDLDFDEWLDDSPSPCDVLEPVMTGLFPHELVRALSLVDTHHDKPK